MYYQFDNTCKTNLNIVSASTSPNHTRKNGLKFSPINSNIATSPPPFSYYIKIYTKAYLQNNEMCLNVCLHT